MRSFALPLALMLSLAACGQRTPEVAMPKAAPQAPTDFIYAEVDIAELQQRYPGDDDRVAEGVYKFLEVFRAKGWIRRQA